MKMLKRWKIKRLEELHAICLELINISEDNDERDFYNNCALLIEKRIKEIAE